jgi:hypothetical protein
MVAFSPNFGDVLLSILAVGAGGNTLCLLNAGILCTALVVLGVTAVLLAVRSGTSVCIKEQPSAPTHNTCKQKNVYKDATLVYSYAEI